jgi:hypothetical protein
VVVVQGEDQRSLPALSGVWAVVVQEVIPAMADQLRGAPMGQQQPLAREAVAVAALLVLQVAVVVV